MNTTQLAADIASRCHEGVHDNLQNFADTIQHMIEDHFLQVLNRNAVLEAEIASLKRRAERAEQAEALWAPVMPKPVRNFEETPASKAYWDKCGEWFTAKIIPTDPDTIKAHAEARHQSQVRLTELLSDLVSDAPDAESGGCSALYRAKP